MMMIIMMMIIIIIIKCLHCLSPAFLISHAFRCIRPYLYSKTASIIATSIVHSKLDYCNSLMMMIIIIITIVWPGKSYCQ